MDGYERDPQFERSRDARFDGIPRRAPTDLEHAARVIARVREHLKDAIVGRDDVLDLIQIALLAGGHVLLEDFPGSGKTVLARALGDAIAGDPHERRIAPFRRIQFTPDLMPSDVTGSSVFDADRASFEFRPGPLFAHVLLADEINRTTPKVQSALLEAMAESQVTVDNETHPLDSLFLVIATQNPHGLAGTFPLPAPQLDRFLFKIRMDHIEREAELEVVATFRRRLHRGESPRSRVPRGEILEARTAIEQQIFVGREIQVCLVDIARAVRADRRVAQGISTRALVQASPALQARALLGGRDFVSTEDLEALLIPLFAHRLALAPGIAAAGEIVRDAAREPLERASRRTMRRDS